METGRDEMRNMDEKAEPSVRQHGAQGHGEPVVVPFPDEIEHLSWVLRNLDGALDDAQREVERLDREYGEFKRYMVAYRNEVDSHEKLQDERLLDQADRAGALAVELQARVQKLRDSPYFARIDFALKGRKPVAYYIGRFGFSRGRQRLVVDWRAPISSVFYDCGIGPAGYDAPAGRIEGELTRKRQFKISGGVMEYAFESSEALRDEALQRELAHASDEKMKSIISTIQQEQNAIIRNETADTLLIQGVAGSGKTSVALHRVAYLLYRFRGRLSADDVAVVSPNRVFGDYISTVIPELGEEPIVQLDLESIAAKALGGMVGFQPPKAVIGRDSGEWSQRARFKSTLRFARQLEDYGKRCADELRKQGADGDGRDGRQGGVSDLQRRGGGSRGKRASAPELLDLYRGFFDSIGAPEMLAMPQRNVLEWEDVFPVILLGALCGGRGVNRDVKHLVVDEMQDYTPVQHAALRALFPASRKTILGDFGQVLNPLHLHSLEDIRELYGDAQLVTLVKSYRSTFEIMEFAKGVCRQPGLEAVKRHGQRPSVVRCEDALSQMRALEREIHRFLRGCNVTLGVIAKTDEDAHRIHQGLSCSANLLAPDSVRFSNGVSVASVSMAKGLEFDEVIVVDADVETYGADFDRNLLYIACTRAMHRLTVLHTGEPSPFLPQG